MTTLRQPYYELSPAVYNALVQAKTALENSTLDTTLMELIYLRVSQINGCAFCLEMHSKALRKSGVPQHKLDALAGWRGATTGNSLFKRRAQPGVASRRYCFG